MFVMMPVQENKDRLARLKGGHYFLVIKTDVDTRQHIWSMVQSSYTYAYQLAYKRGIERGIAKGVDMK
jgi:hypothetical protein